MTKEIWKSIIIDDEEWPYEVSNIGRVQRNKPGPHTRVGKVLRQQSDKDGYRFVTLFKQGQYEIMKAHRLVLNAFTGPEKEGYETNHINGIKKDNRIGNLQWVSSSQNKRHAFETGLWIPLKGSKNGVAKLSENDVIKIRRLWSTGENSQRSLAKKFNVSYSAIWSVVHYKNWRHVDG